EAGEALHGVDRADSHRRYAGAYDISARLIVVSVAGNGEACHASVRIPPNFDGDHGALRLDAFDGHFRVRLTVTLLAAIVLLGLVLENDNFLALYMLLDL